MRSKIYSTKKIEKISTSRVSYLKPTPTNFTPKRLFCLYSNLEGFLNLCFKLYNIHDSIAESNCIDRIKNSRSITFICTSIPKYSSKLYFITIFLKLRILDAFSVLYGLNIILRINTKQTMSWTRKNMLSHVGLHVMLNCKHPSPPPLLPSAHASTASYKKAQRTHKVLS
jgi:hypothetical protein